MIKKEVSFAFFSLLLVAASFIIFAENVSAAEVFYCAERTTSGAWCQNVPLAQVDKAFRSAQTNCESTSFCRLGTCVDSQKGLCRPNVAQRVCQQSGGSFELGKPEDIQQCQLGCCLMGDQAAFVTQTECRGLASQYGVNTQFRSDIRTNDQCLVLSNPNAKGACVIDDGATRDCQIKTKAECNEFKSAGTNRSVEFSEGLLCTAEVLATRCAPTQKTTCVEGKFEVYFVDSCGNTANVYDSAMINNKEYWTNMKTPAESCGAGSANVNSRSCGNCDYAAGSLCMPFQRGSEKTPTAPQYGDFICGDLSCKYKGKTYQHGEEWCAADFPGINKSLPGSESYVLQCYNGEVTSEICDPRRSGVCRQGESNEGYSTASCVANLWQDCVDQKTKESCENIDQRDCQWVVGKTRASLVNVNNGTNLIVNSEGELVAGTGASTEVGGACLPRYAPGQEIASATSEEEETFCFAASENCVVKFSRGNKFEDLKCKENCHCLDPNWAKEKATMCFALGDCGPKTNYLGVKGDNKDAIEIQGGSPKGWDLVGDIKRKLNAAVKEAAR